MTRSTAAVLTVIALGVSAAAQAPATPQKPPAEAPAAAAAESPAIPSDQYIRDVLIKRIDTDKQSIGIIVGVIEPKGRRIVSYGRPAAGDARPLDGDTVFEIGSIETLVASRITGPLGMKSTRLMLSPDMKARMATGHNGQLTATANWDFPADTSALGGAGGLRSTVNDMLTFLAANMNANAAKDATKPSTGAATPLVPAMTSLLATRRPTGNPGLDMALGWHIVKTPGGREIVWHNGGTGGFRSWAGFDATHGLGVVVLSNTSTQRGVDDIGVHLLVNRAARRRIARRAARASETTAPSDRFVERWSVPAAPSPFRAPDAGC
jgi:CubicO group peptidase (beta-lactamase class C family)